MTIPHSAAFPLQRWQERGGSEQSQSQVVQQLAQATGLSPIVARVLMNRGITTPEEAEAFLNPEVLGLASPLAEFTDLPHSLDLLADAIARQDKIAICGDYDADGMTSTALLIRALRSLGAAVDYAIPSRMREGYGINDRIVEDFQRQGVQLILTVDNGIAAYQPIALARDLGLKVIVTDHHDLPPQLPPANAILNPKLLAGNSPYRGLAGVGVAYVLAVSLAQHLDQPQDFVNSALELFTLGTIADLAPLVGVNRRWVKRGLSRLPHSKVPGVQALIRVAGLDESEQMPLKASGTTSERGSSHPPAPKKSLKPDDIGFQLGPRINAIGRIGDPDVVIKLLTTEDLETAYDLAQECEDANQYRRQLCQEIEAEAIALCEDYLPSLGEDKVLVLCHSDWHHGVIGIVASRLVERYGVPVFIATPEDESHIRGSARGIPEFNVFEALEYSKSVLERHGGHRAAGGFSLQSDRWDTFRQFLIEFANQSLEPQHLKPLVNLDGETPLTEITWDLYQQIDSLHPWGIDNPEPVFWSRNLHILEQSLMGAEKQHLRLLLSPSRSTGGFKAVFWQGGRYFPLPSPLDVAFRLRQNTWKGETSLQLEVAGVRESGANLPASPPIPQGSAQFIHRDRSYSCAWSQTPQGWELRIRNDRQQVLAIPQGADYGLLGSDRASSKSVNIHKAPFAELITLAQQALPQPQHGG